MSEKHFFARLLLVFISFICFSGLAFADDTPETECFTYEYGSNNEIISGLTEHGRAAKSLTIPKNVKTIRSSAFNGSNLESLYILGNPVFEIKNGTSALTVVKETLSFLNLGSNMSLGNIYNLLLNAYGENTGDLKDIIIQDYLDTNTGEKHGPVVWGYVKDENGYGQYQIGEDWYDKNTEDPINQVLTGDVRVIMPAEIVKYQIFGCAQVWGRITLSTSLATSCWEANFYDLDDGSNYLFYVPTKLVTEENTNEKKVYFQRVKIITEKEGVLMHNDTNTSIVVNLPRINIGDKYIEENIQDQIQFGQYEQKMEEIYSKNMLVGVVAPTPLQPTYGEYTNFILYQGMFYPTSGGTLKANRAYLQILTSDYEEMKNNTTSVNLSIVFEDKDEDAIQDIQISHQQSDHNAWFTIDGRKLSSRPTLPGIYVNGGKKVVVGN